MMDMRYVLYPGYTVVYGILNKRLASWQCQWVPKA
mgnify:CR=1 FL=1